MARIPGVEIERLKKQIASVVVDLALLLLEGQNGGGMLGGEVAFQFGACSHQL